MIAAYWMASSGSRDVLDTTKPTIDVFSENRLRVAYFYLIVLVSQPSLFTSLPREVAN